LRRSTDGRLDDPPFGYPGRSGEVRVQDVIYLKPKRTSFLITRVRDVTILSAGLLVVLVVAGVVADSALLWVAAVVQFAMLVGLTLAVAMVAYTKERYEIHPHHMVVHRGGLLSTQTAELDLANVTHVKQHLPWIRYRFFDVGDVIVESAGSSGAEATLRSIREPDSIYDGIRTRLRDNGFALSSTEVVHRARPATIGIVLECLARGGGALIALAWVGGSIVAGIASPESVNPAVVVSVGTLIGLMGILAVLVPTVLHFFDMRRRTYTLTRDAVVYEEGFLSRDNAFIPLENIADADTRRTPIDQIIGLADVRVSCQGSSSEIAFRRLPDADGLTTALKTLVEQVSERQARRATESSVDRDPGTPAATPSRRRTGFEPVPAADAWTAQLSPNLVRATVGLLPLLPVVPVWILASLFAALRAAATSYEVGRGSVSRRFRLLSAHEMSFAYDKITGVVVTRTPFDHLLGTVTVRFHSIGSGVPLDLAHIPESSLNLPALLRQAGIPGGPAVATETTTFDPTVWARSVAGGFIALSLAAVVLLVLAAAHHGAWLLGLVPFALWVGVHFVVQKLRADRQVLTFHPGHVELRRGILIKSHAHARYDTVKKVELTRYPAGTQGRLDLSIAGEIRIQQQGGPGQAGAGGTGAVRQFRLSAEYLPDIDAKRNSIDALLQGEVEPADVDDVVRAAEPDVLDQARPAAANAVLGTALVGILFPPIWLLIPLVVLQVRRVRYRIESNRVVVERGILYRRHTSVLFDRIDSLKQGQGAINKLFGNGEITLFTAGSSAPDLKLSALPGHERLYRLIRSHYGG
jgi:uncharacterized membrane protein YdbT with pleckstrin-like domain